MAAEQKQQSNMKKIAIISALLFVTIGVYQLDNKNICSEFSTLEANAKINSFGSRYYNAR